MVEPLVIPFVVVVRDALADGATPRALADQDQALEAGVLDGAHEALRVGVQVRQARGRPRLRPVDRLFWTWLCHLWPGWRRALVIVKPDTVLRWHRRGFRCYWRWKSRPRGPGRPRIPRAVQVLIRQMCHANPTWGAPRIHGELRRCCMVRPGRPVKGD